MISILNIALILPLQAAPTTPTSLTHVITGIVKHDGKPVKNAIVHFRRRKLPLSDGRLSMAIEVVEELAKTDRNGHFKLLLTAWRNYSAYARKNGLISTITDEIAIHFQHLEFELAPMEAVKGKLVYRGKAPGRKIPIRLYRSTAQDLAVPFIVSSVANEDGIFSINELPGARWQLMLGGPERRLVRTVILENGQANNRIELQRAISLDCRISTTGSDSGRPIGAVKIELSDGLQFFTTESDASGMFRLQGLERGPGATFLVEANGYRKELLALEPGLSPRDKRPHAQLAMRKGREIRGKLVDLDGKPLAGIGVLLSSRISVTNGLPIHDLSVYMESKADGSFRTTAAEPNGVYDLLLILSDGEPQYLRMIQAEQGGPDFGTFKVGAQRARAIVKIPTGMSADMELRIYGAKESGAYLDYKTMLPMADGSHITPTMAEGEYLIVAMSKTLGLARGMVHIRQLAKPVTDVSLTMAKPRLITGKVQDKHGNPMQGYQIRLLQSGSMPGGSSKNWTNIVMDRITDMTYPDKSYPKLAISDEKGEYRLTCHEASGEYDFIVMAPDDRSGGQDVVLRITGITGRPNPLNIILR